MSSRSIMIALVALASSLGVASAQAPIRRTTPVGQQTPKVAPAPASSTESAESASTAEGSDAERKVEDLTISKSFAWTIANETGQRAPAEIDTTVIDYSLKQVPTWVSPGYVTTGNYGAEGIRMLYFERQQPTEFFFTESLEPYIPTVNNFKFYNTRIPMTLLSYNFGGDNTTGQDRLNAQFSGNINRKAQVGAMVNYIYSRGSYNYQADKNLSWGVNGSYIGDKLEFQGLFCHFNSLNKENGGITNDLYITDPAAIQGGSTDVDFKNIPTRLTAAHSRVRGGQLFLNGRYKIGFYKDVPQEDTILKEFVPVTAFFANFDYNYGRHMFLNTNAQQDKEFWEHTYLQVGSTEDNNETHIVTATAGVELLEGFNKYAKAGLALYLKYEHQRFVQNPDTLPHAIPDDPDSQLTPLPFEVSPTGSKDNQIKLGAILARRQGRIINYTAQAEVGLLGGAIGEVEVSGDIRTNIPLFGDTLAITGYGRFSNLAAPYFYEQYISNHFAWSNSFGMTRRVAFGGEIDFAPTRTRITVDVENAQNLIYFNEKCLPTQNSGNVQLICAALHQDLKFGIFNWRNSVYWQMSSDHQTVPLPALTVRSNMFLLFRAFKVLDVQFGVSCDYYTRYKALGYQPALMTFYNQQEAECGNFPFMNLYVNMRLKRAVFYFMFSHINQGLTGNDYFSMPHYPLNPRRFQLGVSVNFAD